MLRPKTTFLILIGLFFTTSTFSQIADSLTLKDGLVIKLDTRKSNTILAPDPVAALIETGKWKMPSVNEALEYGGKQLGYWKAIKANENGWIQNDSLTDSYIQYLLTSDQEKVVLVEAMGNTVLYVNGKERSGNPYRSQDTYESWGPRFDYSLIPVKLKKGENELLFKCNRGVLKVRILTYKTGVIYDLKDLTIPNPLAGQVTDSYGSVAVINASEKYLKNVAIKTWAEGSTPELLMVNNILPLSIGKIPFRIKLPAYSKTGDLKFNLELITKEKDSEKILSTSGITLQIVNVNDTHKETFISKIDNSVQYYAVNPPVNLKSKPALFLSLHGAGVEAINQAESYGHKTWGYIVSPTNRRPYGYNWENWGRIDALEVLEIAKNKFGIDDNRVYLTGHSMGGHGTWHLGINYADKFAAIGPSAGWISIWSYRIKPQNDTTGIEKLLTRSAKHSDTYAFTENLKLNGIYILHGEIDDNVPIKQAESIIANLSKFHKDYTYHFEPGANHWWDNSDEPGADCVDWQPMFDFFAHHSLPGNDKIKEIDFATANPAISSKNYWVEIINQKKQQELSKIKLKLEYGNRKFIGSTENISMFSIDASVLTNDKPITLELDKQIINDVPIPSDGKIYIANSDDKWVVSNPVDYKRKYPVRCGNMREAFNNNVIFVYGTHGSKEENEWALEKAKLDAEKIWYRGNSSVLIIEDNEFDPVKYKDRSVILFGNSKTNSAWKLLLNDSPVQVESKKITVNNKSYSGKDLGCLMIRPRKDSETACVGVISGTGIDGMKLVNLAPYFDQYIGFPDIIIFDSGVLQSVDKGVKMLGYFGNDWSVENGEFITK